MFDLKNLNKDDYKAVENFRRYLRIPSVHPDIDYEPCVEFLKQYGKEIDVPVTVYTPHPNKPVVVFKWLGTEPGLSAILLNSHMDVVPVFLDKWKYDPFEAHVDDDGNIFARGVQDVKCVAIQYLEAIRRLKTNGVKPKRTIYVTFVPDEEIGLLGFREFVKTDDFRTFNVGFGLDEGSVSLNDDFIVLYGEKSCWQFTVHCPGQSGHGSRLFPNTAGEKLRYIIDKFSDYRQSELKRLETNPSLKIWDITSVNLTQVKGGVQVNVIPEEFSATYDIRISPSLNLKEWEETISRWCKEAGADVWIEYEEKEPQRPLTKLEGNPYWSAMLKAAENFKVTLKPQIALGATDIRYLRERNIPAFSISALRRSTSLAHQNNECLNINVFLEGIDFYCQLLPELSTV